MELELVQGNIVAQEVDAIVNAANSSLMGGGGVDGAIHRAGGPQILEECKVWVAAHGRLPAGHAMITSGGKLRARHVIHTVGPFYNDGRHGEAETLARCYTESLRLAEEHALTSIAFPAISTGAYRYPMDEAARVALRAVKSARLASLRLVRFVLFDAAALADYRAALDALDHLE
jgi:O-acetyl-ADP-ribose deacetylase (regulator of RNase III)